MATTTSKATGTKRTTAKKPTAPSRPVSENKIDKPIVEEKKKFNNTDGIMCRSITVGGLYLDGLKSGIFYSWLDYGDEIEVEYWDLVAMVRSKSNFIFAPYIVIENDDFINEFPQLKKFYDDQYTIQDLEGVLRLKADDMVATMKTLPRGALNSLKSIASTQIVEGRLDSMAKIKALDEFFNTNLALIAEYSNK